MSEGVLLQKSIEMLMQGTVNRVDSEVKYVLGFEREFEELKSDLIFLRSYLTDVDKRKDKSQTLEASSVKLRELIYKIDDLITDCQNRLDYEKMKNRCFNNMSLRGICFRYQVGKKLTEIKGEIANMFRALNIDPKGKSVEFDFGRGCGRGVERWSEDVIDESQTVGLAEGTKTLKGWILPCHGFLQVIGIVGMGGLGKTTLAQKIYNDRDVCSQFKTRIWICKSALDEIELLKSILLQLKEDDNGSDKNVLLNRIHEALKGKSYLIVMDDVWCTDDGWWTRISARLPQEKEQSSCVIITSRIEDVVKEMVAEDGDIFRPKVLSEEEGWLLFCKVAFKSSMGKCKDTEKECVGHAILKKCSGLPLAIKTIGALLSSKELLCEWLRISENLPVILENKNQSHDSVLATLQLSYDELSPELKQCILCFAIYPEDCEIDADQLANWWIGEGFVYKKGTTIARKIALECLSDLISRCLLEAVKKRNYDGRVFSCKMHDMIREMIIRVAKKENFCSFKDNKTANVATKDSRRLGVTKETELQGLDGNSKLRALLLTNANYVGFTRKVALAQVKSLRVLDLSHLKLEENSLFHEKDMWRWIKSLKRLAFLSFKDVSGLTKLPRSIKKLWGLQILVLTGCKKLKRLPKSVTQLPNLIVLDVANCTSLSYLPRALSNLSRLQELYGFKIPDAATPNACHLRDLQELKELRVLQLDFMVGSMIDEDELTVLKEFQKLRVLLVDAGDSEDKAFIEKLGKLSPPESLEELYLRRFCGQATPAWLSPEILNKLLYLCIESSDELQEFSKNFMGSNGKKWILEGLCLKYLPKLNETWQQIQSAMPKLKFVEVSHCKSLKSFTCDVMNVDHWRKPEEENEEKPEEENEEEPENEEKPEEETEEKPENEEKPEEENEEEQDAASCMEQNNQAHFKVI